MDNEVFRIKLAENLLKDTAHHKHNEFMFIGKDFNNLDGDRWEKRDNDISLAWNFWEGWIDEVEHNFQGFYGKIKKDDWPKLAREIADCLQNGKDIDNPVIVEEFGPKPYSPGIFDRILNWLKGQK